MKEEFQLTELNQEKITALLCQERSGNRSQYEIAAKQHLLRKFLSYIKDLTDLQKNDKFLRQSIDSWISSRSELFVNVIKILNIELIMYCLQLTKPFLFIIYQTRNSTYIYFFFRTQNIRGTIKWNGIVQKAGEPLSYKKSSCYILQDNLLPAYFTVRELMMISANLKIANISKKSKNYLVSSI